MEKLIRKQKSPKGNYSFIYIYITYSDKTSKRETNKNSPVSGSKPPTTRIELKTDRSVDLKATVKSSARKSKRESNRKATARKESVSI